MKDARQAREAPAHRGPSAAEDPVAKAARLFVEMAEQSADRHAQAPELTAAHGDKAPAPTAVPPQIESGARLSDVERMLETMCGALSAVNDRLASLERIILTGQPAVAEAAEPAFQLSNRPERWTSSSFQLDDDQESRMEIEAASHGLAVLGLIPKVDSWKDRTIALVGEATEEERHAAEAYRALCSNVALLSSDLRVGTIQVTSPAQGAGKSTTAANLAVLLAEDGNRVIAMCCDLRRPRLHEFFGLSNEMGLTSVLQSRVTLQGAVQQVPGIPSLMVVTSGPVAANSPELLLSQRAADVISVLQKQCDFLLIDSPPVLPVSDAVAMSQRVQGTILVVNTGSTDRHELRKAVNVLREVNASLLGTVVNAIPPSLGPAPQRAASGTSTPADPSSDASPGQRDPALPTGSSGVDVGSDERDGRARAPEGSRPPVGAASRDRRIWSR